MKQKIKESDIAKKAMEWLILDGWDVYPEVAPWGAGMPRCDLVGVRKLRHATIIWAIECKTSMSIKVIEQAVKWKQHAHYSSVCIPRPARRGNISGITICETMGIGVLFFPRKIDKDIHERLKPVFHRIISTVILNNLHEDCKRADPSAPSGYFSTPYQRTLIEAKKYLRGKEWISLKTVMSYISHHYKGNNNRAAQSFKKAIERFDTPFELDTSKRPVKIRLKETA